MIRNNLEDELNRILKKIKGASRFRIKNEIAQGSYKRVFEAEERLSDNFNGENIKETIVAKVITPSEWSDDVKQKASGSIKGIDVSTFNEASIQHNIVSQFVPQFKGVYTFKSPILEFLNLSKKRIFYFESFCGESLDNLVNKYDVSCDIKNSSGDLLVDNISKDNVRRLIVNNEEIVQLIFCVAKALNAVTNSNQNIRKYHGDIHSKNISYQINNGILKGYLLDFGMPSSMFNTSYALTRSPEFFNYIENPTKDNLNKINIKTDVFSLMCVVYKLITGVYPISDINNDHNSDLNWSSLKFDEKKSIRHKMFNKYNSLTQNKFNELIDNLNEKYNPLKDLFRKMLCIDSQERLSPEDIINYLNSLHLGEKYVAEIDNNLNKRVNILKDRFNTFSETYFKSTDLSVIYNLNNEIDKDTFDFKKVDIDSLGLYNGYLKKINSDGILYSYYFDLSEGVWGGLIKFVSDSSLLLEYPILHTVLKIENLSKFRIEIQSSDFQKGTTKRDLIALNENQYYDIYTPLDGIFQHKNYSPEKIDEIKWILDSNYVLDTTKDPIMHIKQIDFCKFRFKFRSEAR